MATNIPPAAAGNANSMPQNRQQEPADQQQQDIENREAYEYWGYLFKPDKTGTDKLKSLLRGLKELINANYEPSDNPDLTPNQLAHFYRELNGNYDQLFLGTPSDSIAFIYKSLGCLHSLQPLPHSAFTDPTIPALKTEGWVMWQTIQLLLGPEEHSSFLMEAVQKWDVKDPATGNDFPKILPRQCFPMEPDKHMMAWYEGVSERLRREAEQEERQREIEAEQAEVRRIHDRRRDDIDEDESVDSRGPALAYFRNPLYRHVDGRPTIVTRNSKRPGLSPRPTMMDKGKGAASSMGHVIRNIGSPHLWEGRGGSKHESRDRSRRRRSLPDNRRQSGDAGHSSRLAAPEDSSQYQRRCSTQLDRSPTVGAEDERSPRATSHHRHHDEEYDPTLRHSRSHEPTPSQKEVPDYFHGYDDPERRGSDQASNGVTPNGIGPSFGPSASPLFMAHLAKQPQPYRGPPAGAPHLSDGYGPPRQPQFNRTQQERPYNHSPDPSMRSRERDHRDNRDSRRHSSRDHHSRHRHSRDYDHGRNSVSSAQPGFPPPAGYDNGPGNAPPYPPSNRGHRSGSDISQGYSGPDDREKRNSRPKQARFESGAGGRRYPQ